MKLLLVFACFFVCAYGNHCYEKVQKACQSNHGSLSDELCNAKYGKIEVLASDLGKFASKNIAHNFQYLLLSTHFKNYEKNREGFQRMFRKLSDQTWEDAINLIKYMGKRGISMTFEQDDRDKLITLTNNTYSIYEIHSLATALDIQKSLANEANRIHKVAKGDGEIMSYIQNNFVHQLRDSIRQIAGHTTDFKNLVAKEVREVDVYLFDEYLQKLY